jgi:hypothetical protein
MSTYTPFKNLKRGDFLHFIDPHTLATKQFSIKDVTLLRKSNKVSVECFRVSEDLAFKVFDSVDDIPSVFFEFPDPSASSVVVNWKWEDKGDVIPMPLPLFTTLDELNQWKAKL